MTIRERLINGSIRLVAHAILDLKTEGLDRIPRTGPGIVLSNHTTNLEGPILYVLLSPRSSTGLGKYELWQNRFTRFFVEAWGLIPLRRTGIDRDALRTAFRSLEAGQYLGIAPEGTRSKSGGLSRGMPGAAMIAARSGVPVYPVAHWGLTALGQNLKRGKRTPVVFRAGPPFRVRHPESGSISGADRDRVLQEMMYQLATILPPQHRGVYSDIENRTTEFLEFL